jgi:hypothetical protein
MPESTMHSGLWIKKVMDAVNTSLNDLPSRRLIHKLTNGIDKINLNKRKGQDYILMDSHILETNDDYTTDPPTQNKFHERDKDNPTMTEAVDPSNDKIIIQDQSTIPLTKGVINKLNVVNDSSQSAQSDSGANRIVTDDLTKLTDIRYINPIPMGGCNKDDPSAITCTAIGILQLESTSGQILKTKAYYSKEVDGTIISPTTMISQHRQQFSGWTQHSDCDNKSGYITLLACTGPDLIFPLVCANDLWYHATDSIHLPDKPNINCLNHAANYNYGTSEWDIQDKQSWKTFISIL